MSEQEVIDTPEAADEAAFSLTPVSTGPWKEEGNEEAGSGEQEEDDTLTPDPSPSGGRGEDEKDDSGTVRLGDEDVSRETLTRAYAEFKAATEDEELKSWFEGENPASLVEMAKAGAQITTILNRQGEDEKASFELVGDVLARHFAAHGTDEETAQEESLDVLYQIKHPETLAPAARPFYEAARAASGIAARQYQIAQGLAQQLQDANEKIAELEQGPELLKNLKAQVPEAEISAAELKSWMKKIGTESPKVAYRAYQAELEEKGAKDKAAGKANAEAKQTLKQPKTGSAGTFVATAETEPSEIFRAIQQGKTVIRK